MTGCWLWTGALNDSGYGIVKWEGRAQRVHRLAYEAFWGPVPAGLELDHLCRVRACYNPWHLEAVTRPVNQRRGFGASGVNARKTACPQGHAYHVRANGRRVCLVCRRAEWSRWKARRARRR